MGRILGVTPEETKERLQDAAARVFERNGFEKATTAEIAREAGVSSGCDLRSLRHKGRASRRRPAFPREARHVPRCSRPGSRMDAVHVLVTLGSRLANREPADTALLSEALLASRRDPELGSVLAQALTDRSRLMASVITDGQAKGELTSDISADIAARFALMLGLGSMLVSELEMPAIDQEDWNAFMRRFIGAFTPEEPE